MAPAPTAVVFDVGNVLYDWDPRLLYERLIPDVSALDTFLRDVVTREWHFQHDAGRSFAETCAELTAQYPHFAEAIAAWGPRFGEQVAPMPGMAALVSLLRARGVPLYAITNFSHEFWPPFRRQYEALFEGFVDIVVSGEERLTKPDPVLYRRALDRFDVMAADALFVDDRADNIAGAAAVGMATHLFTDAAALRAALLDFRLIDPDMPGTIEESVP